MRGIHAIEEELAELFGETPVRSAVRNLVDNRISKPRQNGSLRVRPNSGLLVPSVAAASSVAIPTNNFHGD